MKAFLRCCLTLVSVIAALPGFTDDLASIRRAIDAQASKLNSAYIKKDMKALKSILTDDFVAESAEGQMFSRPEYLTRTTAAMGVLTLKAAQSSILSIKMQKGIAVLKCQNRATGRLAIGKGKTGAYVSTYQSKEQWVSKNGTWKLHYAKEMPGGKTTLDGKPVNPS